ncbi:MAG: cellulase family glycosylhydrolase [Thermoanaerobaculia bacterium]
MMRVRVSSLALATLLLAFEAGPAKAFRVPLPNDPGRYTCSQQPILLGVDDVDGNTSLETAAHLGWMRVTLRWSFIEPSDNAFDYSRYDAQITAAANQGIKILGVLSTAPQWAGSNANGTTPPANVALWQDFVRNVAIHFRGKVTAYEIWNEPNFGDLGVGIGWNLSTSQSPKYVDYLHAAAVEIRNNAPGTLVVGPALSSQPDSKGTTIFQQIESTTYPDGPGSKFLDVVSFHANAQTSDSTATNLSRVDGHLAQITASNVDKPIWITEFGWASEFVGEAGQQQRITNFVESLTGSNFGASSCGAGLPSSGYKQNKFTNVFIYAIKDGSGFTRGIFRPDNSAKPTVSNYTTMFAFPAKHPSTQNTPIAFSCAGRTCTFTNPYNPADPTFTMYVWDFGDGSTSTITGSGGRIVSHTYAGAGRFFVAGGANDINVGDLSQADIQLVNVP